MIEEMIRNIVQANVEGVRVGWDAQQVKIDAILIAYDQALQDPSAKIPTYLHAAIEVARK